MDERSFFYNLGKLVYQLDGVYGAYGKNCNLGSPNLLWILYALNDGERHSQKLICAEWDIPRSTANTIIKDLESKHYITLSQIKGERRELLVSLTESGKKYADGILSDLYRREKEIYSEIEAPEEFIDTLQNLAAKMQRIAAKGDKIMNKKILVAYFSASGTTAKVARDLASAAGAELYEIKPAIPYTRADLDWTDKRSRSSLEMSDKSSRPALADRNAPVSGYDTILLGFPVWWYTAPTIVNSFLESYDFSGKKIVLFATSGGSGFGHTREDLSKSVGNDTTIIEGKIMNGAYSAAELESLIGKLLG